MYVGTLPNLVESGKLTHFLKELGVDFRYEQSAEIPDLTKGVFNAIRFSESFLKDAYHKAKGVTPLMVHLQVVDLLYHKNGEYWPKLLLRDGLHSVILHKHPKLSAREGGLIVGSGVEAKLVASVLIELGFSHITFVDDEETVSVDFINEMKAIYFQIKIEVIGPHKVILLPGIYSVIINTWDIVAESDLLTDLLYFNYLKEPGLVINLKKPQDFDLLIEEAKAIHQKTIQRNEIDVFMELNSIRPFVELNEKNIQNFISSIE